MSDNVIQDNGEEYKIKRKHACVKHKDNAGNPMDELNSYMKKQLPDEGLRVKEQLGSGAFGEVYRGKYKGQTVAIKVEKANRHGKTLRHEYRMYAELKDYPGLPHCLYFHSGDSYRFLVLPYLGQNLEDLQEKTDDNSFNVATVCQIAYQILGHLQCIHARGIVHKDIKPANMTLIANQGGGVGLVTLVDFGLSKRYTDDTGRHKKQTHSDGIEGTVRFMGIHTHQGYAASRRDDLQALAYTLIYFLKGKLPWQGLRKKRSLSDNEKREKTMKLKQEIKREVLCSGLPSAFEKFLKYVNALEFEETPNYDHWKREFYNLHLQQMDRSFMQYNPI